MNSNSRRLLFMAGTAAVVLFVAPRVVRGALLRFTSTLVRDQRHGG